MMNHDKRLREIRIVFSIFAGIIAVLAWRSYPSVITYLLFAASLLLLLIIIFSPLSLDPLFQVWIKASYTIGRINTQVLLTLLFVFIFIPVGILMRIFRKDPMKRGFSSNNSYWEEYKLEGVKDSNRYERQF